MMAATSGQILGEIWKGTGVNVFFFLKGQVPLWTEIRVVSKDTVTVF